MSKENAYSISPVEEKDVESIKDLVKRTFYIDEPLIKTVGLCTADPETCPGLDEFWMDNILEGFSFKATDHDGNIVGVLINGISPLTEEIYKDLIRRAEQCTNPKFQKIIYILARRESGARLWEKFPNDKHVVEIKVAATDPNWRNKGIMNALMEVTEKAVRERGIRLIHLDASSAYSAKTAEKYGYTCYYKELFANIKMDGKPLIVPEPPHLQDSVYIKELFPL